MRFHTSVPNTIDVSATNRALAHTRLGRHVHHYAEVGSTNDLALAAAQAGEPFGAWVADAQTAGRGRGQNTWLSAPGAGLYLSALFTPLLPASALTLSLAAGLAASEAIAEVSGLHVDLRWPNDLVTRTVPSRKLGGVLVETAVSSSSNGPSEHPPRLRYAVIGIGINVAHSQFPPDLAAHATSLRLEGWQTPDRQRLLIALLKALDLHVHTLEQAHAGLHQGPGVLARFAAVSTWASGKRVSVPEEGGYTGTTAGLNPDGFLLVDADDGSRRLVRSGGVRELLIPT